MEVERHDWIPLSLRSIRYTTAAQNIRTIMSERALGLIVNELDSEDIPLYNELEERKLESFRDTLSDMLTEEIYPAIFSYVSRRHPKLVGEFFDEDGSDFFETLEMTVYNTPISEADEKAFFRNRVLGNRIGSFSFSEDTRIRIIEVFFEEIFHNYSQKCIADIEFPDFLFQILLHETLHAISSDLVMPIEKEKEERRRMEVREAILGKAPANWEELVFSAWYGLNFINVGPGSAEEPFRYPPALKLINEAITDILSAKIYSKYTREKYGKARKYKVSYSKEAHIFYRALGDFCKERGLDKNKTLHAIEAGYFFPGDPQISGTDNLILPMLKYCSDLLDEEPNEETIRLTLPFFKSSKRSQ